MTTKFVTTLSACVDCVAYVANGIVPEDRDTLPIEIQDYLQLKPNQHLVNADGCDEDGKPINIDDPASEVYREDWFSWQSCECCGDWHGGNRNRLAILESEVTQ